ncbi:hypothetical protein SAMN05443245_7374 [Paraburkholderia fungorum]|uniref:Uncharacterized protein n=1 Tax=Paraburkholderia fungorum TaxID=134537 RepID=A0A1H1JWQ5_9BURK|nr:hypothetical protein SAMN05443245_7374 [Paraburkholderia fungorum]
MPVKRAPVQSITKTLMRGRYDDVFFRSWHSACGESFVFNLTGDIK